VEDNTPTGAARKRKLTPHQRLRLETAKRLQSLSAKSKKRRKEKKELGKTHATDLTVTVTTKEDGDKHDARAPGPASVKSRKPKVKMNKLRAPDTPPAKFRKRQINKTWLPTHLYHAKRAKMTPPTEPLWRFAIPLSPANKVYRVTHRRSSTRGATAWDTSYMSTIGLSGPEKSIEGLLKAIGVGGPDDRDGAWTNRGLKWRNGSRTWEGWLYERQSWPSKAIAPGTVIWNPVVESNATGESDQPTKKAKRQAFIRVHPSGFLKLWAQITRLSTVQKPAVTVEDLRFEIGSIEVVGPSATETLVSILNPLPGNSGQSSQSKVGSVWPLLKAVPDPSVLPRNVALSFEISDLRLRSVVKKDDQPSGQQNMQDWLQILAQWPLDDGLEPASIFDRNSRLKAKRSLPSQQSVNRRKAAAMPGTDPEPRATDPRIPTMLFTSRSSAHKHNSWIILLPWKCVSLVWSSLIHFPLSCGGQPRFAGLDQKRQLAFETGTPWFPCDFPGTAAGNEWEVQERAKRKIVWERKPKGRRLEYESLPLGDGRKGELGLGWACDWDFLAQRESGDVDGGANTTGTVDEAPLFHLPTPFASKFLTKKSLNFDGANCALITVRITMLARGVPKTCARIYRLPSQDQELRQKWIGQRPLPRSQKAADSNSKQSNRPPPKDASRETYGSYLAASILNEQALPGTAAYPVVPGEGDLIGFLTTGNYNLSEGMGSGIGSILLSKVFPLKKDTERGLCIVRDAGETFGRLARWELV
jgi:ribonuclease P/MRP protein subunit POP1